ncbi:hypothetical protein LOY55_24945 [Pseudomonas sp. B21-040]|jgi:hypothetical protein|uniref:Uncharacterized protein n=1 Tax=Pseudomonas fluorescens NCIMB 11764 TaxID=1221522 RepID=A0A0K1QM92_PSEFL|nr:MULTISPECIES: hypothetical protein [Pseudomonas]AKV06823.1 hypothetical protein B723_10600 [Pseudomonas fluorescens NCIMB 11764]UVL39447.1 hypothetical protein LOY55_24945 [Pseudomonas sp. B21-040]
MLTDLQARLSLAELAEKYLEGRDPAYGRLIEVIHDPARQVPIKGVLEAIRRYQKAPYTQQELELIDDLLYMYG